MVKAILHTFQEKAVQELLKKGTKQIVENNTVKDAMENPIIFSSPTGSGKTIMSISFIQRLNNYLKQNISNVVESMKVLGHDVDTLNSNVIEKELKPLFIYFVLKILYSILSIFILWNKNFFEKENKKILKQNKIKPTYVENILDSFNNQKSNKNPLKYLIKREQKVFI